MKRVLYRSLCAALCVSMLSASIPINVIADEGQPQETTAEQIDSGKTDNSRNDATDSINANEIDDSSDKYESDVANPSSKQPEPQASLANDLTSDAAQVAMPTVSGYQHADSATSGSVTLTVEWNDPVPGQSTTFHVSATGGSGSYLFRMDAPSYSNPNEYAYEPVADPSRGEWTKYTDLCTSHDYSFTMTATGTYNFRFYLMDKAAGVYYLRTNTYIQVANDGYPSVASIVDKAVSQAEQSTNGSEYEMALYLHDWLLEQLEYDNSLKWSSAESALTRGLGTCQAYESAYAKLLSAAGIENAETRDTYDGHTWNAVRIDGEWYQVDCTWDDTSDNFYGDLDQRHLYFCLTDELMAIAHKGHAKIYAADGYATRSTSLKDSYFVHNGKAGEWASAYTNRIRQHLDAKETSFSIGADNASFPPGISGIQNALIAYAMNQREWGTGGKSVTLKAMSNVTTVSSHQWSATFDFEVEYPETPVTPDIPERTVEDGSYVAASSLAPRLAVEASPTPRLSSGSPQVRLERDAATGLYRVSSGGKLLTDGGSKATFEAAGLDGQLWLVRADGEGHALLTADGSRALDVPGGSAYDGAALQLHRANGTAAQRWLLSAI